MIFAVHPLMVETVAYVSELKNLLSGVFFLLAVWCWLKWAGEVGERRSAVGVGQDGSAEHAQGPFPEHGTRGHLFYAGVVICFVVAMLAKSVTCTLPVVLLLVEYWRRGRVGRREVLAVVPLFVVGGVIAGVFVWVEHSAVGASGAGFGFSVMERVVIAGRALWFYVGKFFWPVELLTVYPRWAMPGVAAVVWLIPASAGAVVLGLWFERGRMGRGPFVVAAMYSVLIGPSLGLVVYYPMLFTFVADHYLYLGLIPLAVGVAGVGHWLLGGWPKGACVAAAVGGVLLAPVTWKQAMRWRDPVALWGATVEGNGESWYTTANFAYALVEAGDNARAAHWAQASLALKEDNARAHLPLARAALRGGAAAAAIKEYHRGLELEPTNAVAWANLGFALEQTGDLPDARLAYETTLRLDPNQPKVWNEVAVLHLRAGEWGAGAGAAQRAVELSPRYGMAYVNLGLSLEKQGDFAGSERALARAAALMPDNARIAEELAHVRQMQAPASAP